MENNNPQSRNENPKKFLDFFIKESNSITDLVHELNKYYGEIRLDNIKQKREFFQHLTILSGAVIGLSSIFGYERILNILYFQIGVFLNLLFIIIITLYFREILDKEANELSAQQDRYNIALNKKGGVIEKHIKNRLFSEEDFISYLQEIESSEEAQFIKSDAEKLEEERKDRLFGKKEMDFSGELFVFLFILASFFILLSFFFSKINLYLFLLMIIFMIGMIFTDSITFFTRKISKLINFIRK